MRPRLLTGWVDTRASLRTPDLLCKPPLSAGNTSCTTLAPLVGRPLVGRHCVCACVCVCDTGGTRVVGSTRSRPLQPCEGRSLFFFFFFFLDPMDNLEQKCGDRG